MTKDTHRGLEPNALAGVLGPPTVLHAGWGYGGKSRVKGGRDASMVSLLGREATKRLRKTAQQRNLA